MKILITTVKIPFVRGGAEFLAESLAKAVRAEGHEVETVSIPFKWYPPHQILDQMLACRLLDLSEFSVPVDRVIALKFPAYLIPHPNKVFWLLHQYRAAYDLWDSALGDLASHPDGSQVRQAIEKADRELIPDSKAVFTISKNISQRLKRYSSIDSTPLYHPPANAESFHCGKSQRYFFFPSRITPLKRQNLVIEAMAHTRQPVRVRFGGGAEHPNYLEELKALAARLKVTKRIEWLDHISEEEKVRQYADSLGVIFPPLDEDYGYVTLEAMLSSKPIITCSDSGGTLEFVQQGHTGFVVKPTPVGLATAMDELWSDPSQACGWGKAGRVFYEELQISWPAVVRRLITV